MRPNPFRILTTAAVLSVSALLLACPVGRLHVLIPDFGTSQVTGVRLYRMDDVSGKLVPAGSLRFLGLETTEAGEVVRYRQLTPDDKPWFGPLQAEVVRNSDQPDAIEVQLSFLNDLPAGWFRVATYNAAGTSRPSRSQTYIEEGQS
jgi:hypothetical protein